MFEKLKQIKDLRSQAKTMQNALAGETVSLEKSNIKVTMNGNLEISSLEIGEGMTKAQIEVAVKEAVNDTVKKAQKVIAQKMQEMGGLKNFGM